MICLLGPGSVCAQTPTADDFSADVDGWLYSLAGQTNGQLLAGGSFLYLGSSQCDDLGRLNSDGSVDTGFSSEPNGTVYSLAVQPDGKIVLGGGFMWVGGPDLGRLNADGTVDDAFSPYTDNVVNGTVVQADGKILVGGGFANLCGQPHQHIGRLNADGSLDSAFNVSADNAVNWVVVQTNGQILVGGAFTNLCGQAHKYLGRLNPDGTLDSTFNPAVGNVVNVAAVQADGKILLGGLFTNLCGQTRKYIGRLNGDGTLDTAFNPGADNVVSALALQTDGTILVGGGFKTLAGQNRTNLARLKVDGTLDTGFNPGADGAVNLLAVQGDGGILVGGAFSTLGGQARFHFGRLYNTGSPTQSLSFASSTLTWLRGGTGPEVWRTSFSTSTNGVDWVSRGAGSRITGGWQLTGLTLPAGTSVHAQGFVCGAYGNASSWFVDAYFGAPLLASQPISLTNDAGTTASFSVAAVNSTPLSSFRWLKQGVALTDGGNVSGAGTATLTLTNVLHADAANYSVVLSNAFGSLTSAIASLTVVDPLITVQPANEFGDVGQNVTLSVTAVGTLPFGYQWHKGQTNLPGRTTAWLTLTNAQLSDAGNYLVVVSNRWGMLTSATAQLTMNLATRDTSFNPGTTNPGAPNGMYAMAVQPDGNILLGGNFLTVAGQSRSYLARVNAGGSLDTGFNPGAGGPVYPAVYGFGVRPDLSVLVVGSFQALGGQTRSNIALLNANGTLNGGFTTGVFGWLPFVYALAMQADGKTLFGGYVPAVGSRPTSNVARLNPDGTFDTSLIVDLDTYLYTLAMQTNGSILLGGGFTNLWEPGESPVGESHLFLARLNAGGTIESTFHAGTDGGIYAVAIQADGRILVGGDFWELGYFYDPGTWQPQPHRTLARVNADGTVDTTFAPAVDGAINTIVLQADGKVLVGGVLSVQGADGWAAANLARFNSDGSVDSMFNASADAEVYGLALQGDGQILVGGAFANLCGQPCYNIGRLHNTEPVTNNLACAGSTINWVRGGACPEVWRTTFEDSSDGTNWTLLGAGARVAGGWQLTGVSVPGGATVRARGYTVGGFHNASAWFVETLAAAGPPRPQIARDGKFGFGTNGFGFDLAGTAGQVLAVDCSSNLVNWVPLQTNTLGSGPWFFTDPASKTKARQFYRARVVQ